MSKLLVEVDDDMLARAAHRLGTKTKKDTVNAALAEVAQDTEEEEGAAMQRFRRVVQESGQRLAAIPEEEMWR